MRFLLALWLAVAGLAPAAAQVTFGLSSGPVSIGINIPVFPSLVQVPGYPVYYAPGVNTNYFFYDGLYWVFANGTWYESSWYNGPWYPVAPDAVPLYVLRVPVRYYRHPPAFFRGWRSDAPPRWDEHWGRGWAENHRDWNHWDRAHAPRPAPVPTYQRRYSGANYPHDEARQREHMQEYRYQPRDQAVQQHYERHYGAPGSQRYEQRGGEQRYEQRGAQPQRHEQRGGEPQRYEQRGGEPQRYEQRQGPQQREQRAAPQQREQRGRDSGAPQEPIDPQRSGG